MTRQGLFSIFFIALLLLITSQIFVIFAPFFQPIFWAAILAFTFYPVFEALKRFFKDRRGPAAFLTTLLILSLALPFAAFVVVKFAEQALEFLHFVSEAVNEGRIEGWIGQLRAHPWIQQIEKKALSLHGVDEMFREWISKLSQHAGTFTVQTAGSITKNILLFQAGFFLTIFLVFFFLRDGHGIIKFIYTITPLEDSEKKVIFRQITETFAAVIRGQILTAFVQGLLAGTIFYFLGLPVPVLIGAITFLASLVPFLGATGVWLPFVVYLFFSQQNIKAVILLLLGVFVISLVDNFLKPALIGEKTKLPYLLLFLGIMGGLIVYGFLGIFLAPVVMTLFFALIKIYQEKYTLQ
jgi:predicted PurR-regulated permease PerM